MNKFLVICGPTATGKTKLALNLAKKFNGELISADSRQVYRNLDIGTGKDLPKNTKYEIRNTKLGGYYEIDGIRIWGYDLVSPKSEFSVSHYEKIVREIIKDICERNSLPIIVGGTGFYIKALVDGIDTINIPKNDRLRQKLARYSLAELYNKLSQLDSSKAESLNISDRQNPRRLVRAIEVAVWQIDHKTKNITLNIPQKNVLFIGLKAPSAILKIKIKNRVMKRLKMGIENEIRFLLAQGVTWENQSMNTFAYKEWQAYFAKEATKKQVIEKWLDDEENYAREQMIWFKKDKRINWFDITNDDWEKGVEKIAQQWYSSSKENHG